MQGSGGFAKIVRGFASANDAGERFVQAQLFFLTGQLIKRGEKWAKIAQLPTHRPVCRSESRASGPPGDAARDARHVPAAALRAHADADAHRLGHDARGPWSQAKIDLDSGS